MLNWIPQAWQFKDYTTFSTDELMTSFIGDFYDIEYLIKTIPQKSSQKIDDKSRFFTVDLLPSRRLLYTTTSANADDLETMSTFNDWLFFKSTETVFPR